jgi:uncharacterized damage-inducible protein DinB
MARARSLIESIRRARDYTHYVLSGTSPDDWFRMPSEGVSHIAWQVGHLAFAQYSLGLKRLRGTRPEDAHLVPPSFLEKFGRGSAPDPNPQAYPSPAEIRRIFDALHKQVLLEVSALDDAVFDEPLADPHPRFATKGGALVWCAEHEMMHAGQIGLLRRLLGKSPLW